MEQIKNYLIIPIGKAKDYSNQIIGDYKVLYRTEQQNSSREAFWLCQCTKCKTYRIIKSKILKSYPCKCLCNYDLTNKKFDKLTVLYDTNKITSSNHKIWHCKCDCGNECDIDGEHLKNGNTKSCGCSKSESMIDLTNQRFGKLTTLYPTDIKFGKDRSIVWHCLCDCGNECDVKSINLRNGNTKSCGCLQSFEVENIIKLLNENNISFKKEYYFEDLKDEKPLKFDFAIFQNDKLFYLIEFDGEQHFKYKNIGWNTKDNFIKRRKHDLMKNTYCFEHNIPLIRIPYNKKYKLEDLILKTTTFLFKKENEKEYYSL